MGARDSTRCSINPPLLSPPAPSHLAKLLLSYKYYESRGEVCGRGVKERCSVKPCALIGQGILRILTLKNTNIWCVFIAVWNRRGRQSFLRGKILKKNKNMWHNCDCDIFTKLLQKILYMCSPWLYMTHSTSIRFVTLKYTIVLTSTNSPSSESKAWQAYSIQYSMKYCTVEINSSPNQLNRSLHQNTQMSNNSNLSPNLLV